MIIFRSLISIETISNTTPSSKKPITQIHKHTHTDTPTLHKHTKLTHTHTDKTKRRPQNEHYGAGKFESLDNVNEVRTMLAPPWRGAATLRPHTPYRGPDIRGRSPGPLRPPPPGGGAQHPFRIRPHSRGDGGTVAAVDNVNFTIMDTRTKAISQS